MLENGEHEDVCVSVRALLVLETLYLHELPKLVVASKRSLR